MNLLCKAGKHKWEHCKCVRCGQARNEEHLWNGCTCGVCGKVRKEGHDFVLVPGSYKKTFQERYGPYSVYYDCHTSRCSRCGATREDPHQWTGTGCKTVCSVCGCTGRDLAGPMNESFQDKRNNRRIDVSHQWTGNTCVDTCRVCGIQNCNGRHEYVVTAEETEKGPGKTYRTFTAYRCALCGREEKSYTEHDN